ncbi:16S rRNA methyltransferase [Candidatus Fermentibacteria bacterium]|nr:16S rRNA methyltransferase [Candidatus Fermentibacteria bacterium]
MSHGETDIDVLVGDVRAARKYRSVMPEIIRTIGIRELARRETAAEAKKATTRTLHQIAGAYLPGGLQTERWLKTLRSAAPGEFRAACREVMSLHASTQERLPVLGEFYSILLGDLPPIRSVLDIGCGLNPLAIPWMPLAEDCVYAACDIYEDLAVMLCDFFGIVGIRGHAQTQDAVRNAPSDETDVALLLKLLPCLEHIECGAGGRLLDALHARCILISFPVHSLGGRRDKGMGENYERRFLRLTRDRNWSIERFSFPTELVFRVQIDRQPAARLAATAPFAAPVEASSGAMAHAGRRASPAPTHGRSQRTNVNSQSG